MSKQIAERVAAIKAAHPLLGYAQGLIKLRCTGGDQYSGLCPIHDEDTPSFSLHASKGWYCFGCHERGTDVISLVMSVNGCGFMESLEILDPGGDAAISPALKLKIKAGEWRKRQHGAKASADRMTRRMLGEELFDIKQLQLRLGWSTSAWLVAVEAEIAVELADQETEVIRRLNELGSEEPHWWRWMSGRELIEHGWRRLRERWEYE